MCNDRAVRVAWVQICVCMVSRPQCKLNVTPINTHLDFMQPLNKRIPENPKYKHIKATIDTGLFTQYIITELTRRVLCCTKFSTIHNGRHHYGGTYCSRIFYGRIADSTNGCLCLCWQYDSKLGLATLACTYMYMYMYMPWKALRILAHVCKLGTSFNMHTKSFSWARLNVHVLNCLQEPVWASTWSTWKRSGRVSDSGPVCLVSGLP